MAVRGPQNGRQGLERCQPLGFWAFKQLFLNKFFYPSTPPMRKVDDKGGKNEKKQEKKIMLFIVATNIVASRPPERRLTGTPIACANSFIQLPLPPMPFWSLCNLL